MGGDQAGTPCMAIGVRGADGDPGARHGCSRGWSRGRGSRWGGAWRLGGGVDHGRVKPVNYTAMVWDTAAPQMGCFPAARQKECRFERNTKSFPLHSATLSRPFFFFPYKPERCKQDQSPETQEGPRLIKSTLIRMLQRHHHENLSQNFLPCCDSNV